LCTQHIARAMVEHKRKGCIISIPSGAAFRGGLNASHYVTSKAGVVGLTKSAALELAPLGIRVNALAPGLTDTAQPRFGMSDEELQSLSRVVPLGQMATPDEVVNIALMLVSDAASQVTGQTCNSMAN
jgi:NAD(P)-dependent dehydrogenase (short-subunit alcohol dehydrogenase family)